MNRIVASVSLVAFSVTLYINYLSGTGQILGQSAGSVSGMYPTLFTPAGFTFGIWSIIYLFNLGFVILQLVKGFSGGQKFNPSLNVSFWIVCAMNVSWIFAWHSISLVLSLALMVLLLLALVRSYLNSGDLSDGVAELFLEKTTFSIYLSWICVATIANSAILLTAKGIPAYGSSATFLAITMIVVAVALAIFFLLMKKDITFQFVIIWAFYGIYSARYIESFDGSQIVAMVAVYGIIAISLVFLLSRFFKITAQRTS